MTEQGEGPRGHLLDLAFLVGLILKGVDGLVELLAGIPLAFFTHGQIGSLARAITAEELREDPHDLIANLVLHGAAAITSGTALFAAIYLIVHGVVKLAIVISLVVGAHRIYPWAIAALIGFVVFQLVELVSRPSVGVALLTVLDVVIIGLTWREWRQRRTFRETLDSTVAWVRRRSPTAS
ncbi:MAG: DUF2127 domain-containing protein [Acidobacteria bacterium]|nr:DUF2127 domain-containing protein [Acidobacteriota bacterium]